MWKRKVKTLPAPAACCHPFYKDLMQIILYYSHRNHHTFACGYTSSMEGSSNLMFYAVNHYSYIRAIYTGDQNKKYELYFQASFSPCTNTQCVEVHDHASPPPWSLYSCIGTFVSSSLENVLQLQATTKKQKSGWGGQSEEIQLSLTLLKTYLHVPLMPSKYYRENLHPLPPHAAEFYT